MTPEMRAQLVPMLRAAHSGELAAFFAYKGHSDSVSDPIIKQAIQDIATDEIMHIWEIRDMMRLLRVKPDEMRDNIFILIGKFAGWLCHKTGKYFPNLGAQWIESIGKNEYRKMAEMTKGTVFEDKFIKMAKVEEKHEEYFKGLNSENKNSK